MENQETNESVLLGDYLKQKRIEKNFTLEKLAQKTKISINILKALEANDFKNLPSPAYIKGFVTSYVRMLGLPKEEAITKLELTYYKIVGKSFPALDHTKLMGSPTQRPNPEAEEGATTPHEVIENSDNIIESTKSLLPVVIFAAVILVFVGGYKLISSIVESEVSTQKEKDHGPKIESSSALINQPVPTPEVKKEEPSTVSSSESTTPQAATTPEVPVESKPEPEIRRNFPPVEFRSIRGKLFSIKTDAPENTDETILPRTIKSSVNSDLQNVYIKAVDGNTWLSYKIDTNPIESVIIKQGSDLFLQGGEIRIFFGNVNVTKIFYNNYLVDAPSKSGVKSLIFPEESNAKFKLPLFPKATDDILYTSEDYMKRMKVEEEELAKKKQP